MPLSRQESIYLREYNLTRKSTHAAKASGLSAKEGARLEKRADFKRELKRLELEQDEELDLAQFDSKLTRERWLRELAVIGYANIDDYAEITHQGRGVKLKQNRARYLGRAVKSLSSGQWGPKIELHGKESALLAIGRHKGWVQPEGAGDGNGPRSFTLKYNLDDKEVALTVEQSSNGTGESK